MRRKLTLEEVASLEVGQLVYVDTLHVNSHFIRGEEVTCGERFLGRVLDNHWRYGTIWVEPLRVDEQGELNRTRPNDSKQFPAHENQVYEVAKEDIEWSQQQSENRQPPRTQEPVLQTLSGVPQPAS